MDRLLCGALGHWACLAASSPYYGRFAWRGRVIMPYEKWWLLIQTALLLFRLLFEWVPVVPRVRIFLPEIQTFQMRIPIFGWFGYLGTATVFQVLMFFFTRHFGEVVTRDRRRAPFSRL